MHLYDLSPTVRRRIVAEFDAESAARQAERYEQGRESAFQRDAEKWLEFRGYWRRTAGNIDAAPPPSGWQFHVRNAQGNPLLLDLVLLGNDGRYVEIELKTATGRLAMNQSRLVESGKNAHVARSLDDLRHIVGQWEYGKLEATE